MYTTTDYLITRANTRSSDNGLALYNAALKRGWQSESGQRLSGGTARCVICRRSPAPPSVCLVCS